METVTFLILLCVVLCVFLIYNYLRRSKEQESRNLAEDNYAECAAEKVELEIKLTKLNKELAATESTLRRTYADLKKAQADLENTGVKRATDGTFRSSDTTVITPRKSRVVKKAIVAEC